MIASLFPPGVSVVRDAAELAVEALHPAEARQASRMGEARRAEFQLGRACARRALAHLGYHDFALLNDPKRVPVWPRGVVGSITHCEGLCAVAVARESDLLGIGLDAEPLRTLKPGFLARISNETERRHLATLPPAPGKSDWGLLLFSAKESFYKCYFPLARHFLGFRHAVVDFFPETQSFRARLHSSEAPSAAGTRSMTGRFAVDATHVATAVLLPARESATT